VPFGRSWLTGARTLDTKYQATVEAMTAVLVKRAEVGEYMGVVGYYFFFFPNVLIFITPTILLK